MLGFDLAVIEQHIALPENHFPFLTEKALDRTAQVAVDKIVSADGVLRVKAPQLLETAAGAGFEAR
jgi:hypothetical protein